MNCESILRSTSLTCAGMSVVLMFIAAVFDDHRIALMSVGLLVISFLCIVIHAVTH